MNNSNETLFLEYQSGREHYYTIIGTPAAVRQFARSLSDSLAALPAPLDGGRDFPLKDLQIEDASGSRVETWLSFRVEPSTDWFETRRKKSRRWDVLFTVLLGLVLVFAIIGFFNVLGWVLTNVFKIVPNG